MSYATLYNTCRPQTYAETSNRKFLPLKAPIYDQLPVEITPLQITQRTGRTLYPPGQYPMIYPEPIQTAHPGRASYRYYDERAPYMTSYPESLKAFRDGGKGGRNGEFQAILQTEQRGGEIREDFQYREEFEGNDEEQCSACTIEDCANLNTQMWGPHAWEFLHAVSFSYPQNPTRKDKADILTFFKSLRSVLPCEQCRIHFPKLLDKYPLEEHIESRDELTHWLVNAHNDVNRRLGKQEMTYNTVQNKYENMRGQLRCKDS